MKIDVKNLEKSMVEIEISVPFDEFQSYVDKGVEAIALKTKVEGFRPGKAPLDVLKNQVGEMAILEAAANIFLDKNVDKILEENLGGKEVAGQPRADITKLAAGNPLEIKITVAVLPEVTVGEYKGLGLKNVKVTITKAQIDKTIVDILESRAKEIISTNEIVDGNKVEANINITLDKVPVEGGQMPNVAILIGKDYLVPGFDKNLLGKKTGDELEFDLDYPSKHHQKMLAGKTAHFHVKINAVFTREVPTMTDEVAVSLGLKTVAELETAISESMAKQEQDKNDQKLELEMFDKIIVKAKFGDIPEALVQNEAHLMMHEMEEQVEKMGGKMDDYLSAIHKTHDQLVLDFLPNAVKRVKASLVMKEIVKKENLIVTEEELNQELEKMKQMYGSDERFLNAMNNQNYRRYLKNMLVNRKALTILKAENIK